jgi:N-carbamoyl-L-amino-acid hydrolase
MVEAASARHATVSVTCESRAAAVAFDAELGARIGDGLPAVDTAAGHDAGALAGAVPTAMLFVRNPTGVSHSPLEHADDADCLAGVETLVRALGQLTA